MIFSSSDLRDRVVRDRVEEVLRPGARLWRVTLPTFISTASYRIYLQVHDYRPWRGDR